MQTEEPDAAPAPNHAPRADRLAGFVGDVRDDREHSIPLPTGGSIRVMSAEKTAAMLAATGGTAILLTEPPPEWLANADAEELRELQELGVTEHVTDTRDGADTDALISTLLRAHAEHEADAARFDAAEQREHDALKRRYDLLRAPALRQAQRLAAYLTAVVRSVTFVGKKKSRSVGYGSYGFRKNPDAIAIESEPMVLAYLSDHHPALVKVDVTFTLQEVRDLLAALFPAVAEVAEVDPRLALVVTRLRDADASGYSKTDIKKLVYVEGIDVPGVLKTPGADEPWFKTEPPIAESSMLEGR